MYHQSICHRQACNTRRYRSVVEREVTRWPSDFASVEYLGTRLYGRPGIRSCTFNPRPFLVSSHPQVNPDHAHPYPKDRHGCYKTLHYPETSLIHLCYLSPQGRAYDGIRSGIDGRRNRPGRRSERDEGVLHAHTQDWSPPGRSSSQVILSDVTDKALERVVIFMVMVSPG